MLINKNIFFKIFLSTKFQLCRLYKKVVFSSNLDSLKVIFQIT